MNRRTRPFLLFCIILLTLSLPALRASVGGDPEPALSAALTRANASLQQGRVDEAVGVLRSVLSTQPNDALAHQLLCRVFYAQDMADSAVHECELAVSNGPNSSDNHLWLGRSYGMKAQSINPFTAIPLAKKVRDEFERAVQLDPMAPRASSDLGQFYISAPGFAGGDVGKAQEIITRMDPRFPVYSHRLRALLAEDNNDLVTAEAEFRKAISSGVSAAAWIDLAAFYQQHKKSDQAVAAIQSALALSPKDAALVDAASILTAARRAPELAERVLRDYLSSPSKTDEAPAFKVHLQLGKLLARRGDATGAHGQYVAAVALASSYEPARKALERS